MPKQEPKEPIYRLVGKRMADAREGKGLSQLALAQKLKERGLEIQRTSITHMEKGTQRVMLHLLYPIADVLGISIMELLPTKEQVPSTSAELVRESIGGDWVMEVLKGRTKKNKEKKHVD